MSSLSPKDRVSLCSFTFSDGRRCRTPRVAKHARFCFYHAQKEARARTAKKLGKDLAYFFSGDYLSACDLSTALARLIPAVVRGDVKPKTAHTVAYLAQTLMQAIHISEQEYINAFGTDGWRKSVRNSVNSNYDYRFPPDPAPELPPDQAPQVVAGLQTGGGQALQPAPSPHTSLPPTSAEFVQRVVAGLQTGGGQAPQPAPSPHTSLPPTSAELVQRVVAGLQTGGGQAPQPAPSPHTSLPPTSAEFVQRVVAGLQTGGGQDPQPAPASNPTSAPAPPPTAPQPAAVAQPFRGEALPSAAPPKAASPSPAPSPSPISSRAPQTPAARTAPSSPACPPGRNESSCPDPAVPTADETDPLPATQFVPLVAPAVPHKPPRTSPSPPQPAPNRDAYALHFDQGCRLLIDGKPF